MLVELNIENFAIIDRLHLNLNAGLVTFTGETGAGKSIIIDAIDMLLGGRADTTWVRSGVERAHVEGIFRIPESLKAQVNKVLEKEDLLDDPEWVSLGREIRSNGRSTARINGRSVTTSLLREVSEYLVDVHGQSEHLSLLRVTQHLLLLDRYALSQAKPAAHSSDQPNSLQGVLSAYQRTYQKIQANQNQLEKLRSTERDAARRSDMLSFQIQEIDSSRLKTGEEEDLKEERNRLVNAESLAKLAQEALQPLDDGTPESSAVTDQLGQVVHAIAALARIDPKQSALHEEIQSVFETIEELAGSLREYLEKLEFNPRRLDMVEDRLALIHNLKRKYGDSIEGILEFSSRARQDLDAINHASERIEELESERGLLLEQLGQEGQALTAKREIAAQSLSQAIEHELSDLNMSGARFKVAFQQEPKQEGILLKSGERVAFYANGLERVEFLIAPNPGEGFKPLAKIASGGETSRLMLALKNVLAQADEIPTLVFDEIDQGIGGRVGTIVGEKLWKLARQHQVLCITHLPQLAVFGEQHFGVQKNVEDGRTTTLVKKLEGQDRLVELALMMGEVSEGTLKSARELTLTAQNRTAGHPQG